MDEAPAGIVEEEGPAKEAQELADKHEEAALDGRDAVKAQGNGEDIAHKGEPRKECQPRAPPVDSPYSTFRPCRKTRCTPARGSPPPCGRASNGAREDRPVLPRP